MLQFLKKQLKLLYLAGKGVECNLCGRRFRKFLPTGHDLDVLTELEVIGGGFRENCLCPNCYSVDRDRLVAAWLEDHLPKTEHIRLLHIAPDKNVSAFIMGHNNIDYIAGDKFEEGYDYPESVMELDVTSLPFEDESFDLVICNHVLEHVPDDSKAMSELFRVMKIRGRGILQVPISWKIESTLEDPNISDPAEQERRFGQRDHVRIYGPDYVERLKAAGFKVKVEDYFKEQPQTAVKLKLNPKEKLFLVTRP